MNNEKLLDWPGYCDCNWCRAHPPWSGPIKSVPYRAQVLEEAKRLITGDRNKSYGSATENFTNIAKIWNVQFGHMLKDGYEFTAGQVGEAMISVKLARAIAQPKRDNYVDMAGYAACTAEVRSDE